MGIEQLHEHIKNNDIASIKKVMEEENLYIEDGKIFIKDKEDAESKSDFFDKIQLTRKVMLNALYGSITNAASNFFDTRMGQSCTLSGRCTTRHMASKINEILTGKYEIGEVIIAGDTDSVSYKSIIDTDTHGEITMDNLFNKGTVFWNNKDKEYSANPDIKVMHYNAKTKKNEYTSYNYVYRHRVYKPCYKITTSNDKSVMVTGDHSIMVLPRQEPCLQEKQAYNLVKNDILITINGTTTVKNVEQVDDFKDEYVYDIGINGDPYFFADGILVHNSAYFTVPETIKKDLTKEQFIELSDEIGNNVNKSFAEFYKNTFNVPEIQSVVIKCAREICATSSLFIKKKRYAAMVYDEKNFRYDTEGKLGKLKIMGLDIKRADCPVWVQDKLKDTLNEILGKNKKSYNIVDHVREWRNEFMESDPWKMGIPKRVNKLTYYTKVFNQNTKGITIPGHVRASINWNNIVENEHDINSMKITDGFKVIVCKLHPNVYGIDSIAYPIDQGHLPQWFKELPFDKEGMVEVAIDKKVKNIFGILDIDLDLTKINDEEGILEWE